MYEKKVFFGNFMVISITKKRQKWTKTRFRGNFAPRQPTIVLGPTSHLSFWKRIEVSTLKVGLNNKGCLGRINQPLLVGFYIEC